MASTRRPCSRWGRRNSAAATMYAAAAERSARGDVAAAGAAARAVDGIMSVNLWESGDGRAGRRSLWTAPAQTRPGQALPLVTALTARCHAREDQGAGSSGVAEGGT